ncbi:MAG TPA: outer membrane beta-barrel protein [Hyphomicrobiales bacterium]|nr:outer membrane beta-barrel protein [Hyphomicrobiales bacterium]
MTPMNKWASAALSALALVASVSFANAADVYEGDGSIKDEPGYETPYIGWTGFYIGGNIGGIFDETDGVDLFDDDAIFAGGIHLGYNKQLSDRFVVGLEGDVSFLDDDNTDYLSTVRARLGWSRGPMLAYITGGAAFFEFDDGVINDVDTGYVAGAGLEYKIKDNWSVGGEALYYGFEDSTGADPEFWTARARLTYHLGSRY